MPSLEEVLTETDTHSFPELAALAQRVVREVGIDRATQTPVTIPGLTHYSLLSFPAVPGRKVRPVNHELFVSDPVEFSRLSRTLIEVMGQVGAERGKNRVRSERANFFKENGFSRTVYSVQQAISLGLDCCLPENRSRKRAGQYFEDLLASLLDMAKVSHQRVNFRIPVPGFGGGTFNIEVDRVFNIHGPVLSTPGKFAPGDVLMSAKTSSKDRYSKMLVDKTIAERMTETTMPLVAVFHNDVQRTKSDGVSMTFLAQQYLVYTKYLSPPSGVYYSDPPPRATQDPWNKTIRPIDSLFVDDLWKF